jgi:hypothetical protein
LTRRKKKDFAANNTELSSLLIEYEISPLAYLAINSSAFCTFNLKKAEQGRAIKKKRSTCN